MSTVYRTRTPAPIYRNGRIMAKQDRPAALIEKDNVTRGRSPRFRAYDTVKDIAIGPWRDRRWEAVDDGWAAGYRDLF